MPHFVLPSLVTAVAFITSKSFAMTIDTMQSRVACRHAPSHAKGRGKTMIKCELHALEQ